MPEETLDTNVECNHNVQKKYKQEWCQKQNEKVETSLIQNNNE